MMSDKRYRRNIVIWLLGIVVFFSSCERKNGEIRLESPNGKLVARIFKNKNNHLGWLLSAKKEQLIDSSLLGISLSGKDLGKNIKLGKPIIKDVHDAYKLLSSGEEIRYAATRLIVPVINNALHFKWWLICELSDKGFAYRYHIPGMSTHQITGESSSFTIPDSSRVWYFERDNSWKLKSYAGSWTSADMAQMPTISRMGPVQGTPVVVQFPQGGYVLLSEAACFNYSGMRLRAIGHSTFQVDFTEINGFEEAGEFYTPWRVVMYAENLNNLVNNTLITDLSPAPDSGLYKDVSYIRPGKSVWRWWSRGTGNPADERKMIDDAYELGFNYVMIDEGWSQWLSPWIKVKKLCTEGESKGIGIWLWKNSKEINDSSSGWAAMHSWLDSVKASGACGIKVDFMNSESKNTIVFETNLLKAAAKRRLMVDFHGCAQGTGQIRTFPNQLTREAVRGLELNLMDEGPTTAAHNAALPFTRFVTGPADYTPLGLTAPGPTTWAHQLACFVAFTSYLQVMAEDPGFILDDTIARKVLPFLRMVPVCWDTTILLAGSRIGYLAALARRAGSKWFVSILNGGDERNYELDLSFLDKGSYHAMVIMDDLNAPPVRLAGKNQKAVLKGDTLAKPFRVVYRSVNFTQKIKVHLAAGGGYTAVFRQVSL